MQLKSWKDMAISSRLIAVQSALSLLMVLLLAGVIGHYAERYLEDRGIAEMQRTTQRLLDMIATADDSLRLGM